MNDDLGRLIILGAMLAYILFVSVPERFRP